jgi:hypothetical protein
MLIVPVIAEENIFGDMDLKNFHPTSLLICEATVSVKYANTLMVHKLESDLAPPVMFQSEDTGKIALFPPDEEINDKESFGVQSLVGDKHYLIENTTDNVYTTLNVADNFDVKQYNYLLFEDLMSKDSNTQVSLKISFGKTAAANISDSSETFNRTLINSEVIPLVSVIWYCLPLETNQTFPYVINIEASNIDVSGFYIFQFDNDKLVYDCRYSTIFIDSFSNQINAAGTVKTYKAYPGSHDYKWFLPKSSLIDDLNATTIIHIPAEINFRDNTNTKIVGWKDEKDLADDLKASWKNKLIQQGDMTEADKIIDYNITAAYWKFIINTALSYLIYEELQKQLQVSTDYQALVTNTLAATIPLMALSTDKDDFDVIKAMIINGVKMQGYRLEGGDAINPLTGTCIGSVTSKPPPIKPTTNTEWTKPYSDIMTVMHTYDAQQYASKHDGFPGTPQLITDEQGHVDQAAAAVTSIPQDLKSQKTTTILIIVGGSVVLIGILIVIFKYGLRK